LFAELDLAAPPAPTDERLRDLIARAADELGFTSRRMPSGAGHDAQNLANIAPIGMIFVPSGGGISHSPDEFTSAQDMANGASMLLRTVLAVDGGTW
jgi:N-carbamoyl-L-amino-acid hydrolase